MKNILQVRVVTPHYFLDIFKIKMNPEIQYLNPIEAVLLSHMYWPTFRHTVNPQFHQTSHSTLLINPIQMLCLPQETEVSLAA